MKKEKEYVWVVGETNLIINPESRNIFYVCECTNEMPLVGNYKGSLNPDKDNHIFISESEYPESFEFYDYWDFGLLKPYSNIRLERVIW